MGNKTKGKVYMTLEMSLKEREYIKYVAGLHGLSAAAYTRMRALQPIEREEEAA